MTGSPEEQPPATSLGSPSRRLGALGDSPARLQVTWAAALFGLTVGVLMTYVPYEFGAQIFQAIYPHIRLLGAMFLGGGVLLGVAALYPEWPRVVDWFGRAVFLTALVTYWWSASVSRGVASGTVLYPLMMLGVVLEGSQAMRQRGLFALFATLVALAFGSLMAFVPGTFAGPLFLPLRPVMVPLGVMFLATAVGLAVVRSAPARRGLFTLLGGGFAVVGLTLVYGRSWSGVALYAVLAPACFAAGWVPEMPRLTSVRWRLLRGMVVAGVLPLLTLGAFASTAAHDALEQEVWNHVQMAADDEAEWLRQRLGDERDADLLAGERYQRSRGASAAYRVLVVDMEQHRLLQDSHGDDEGGPPHLSPSIEAVMREVYVSERPQDEGEVLESFDSENRRILAAVTRVRGWPWVVVVSADVGSTYAPITRLSAAVVIFLGMVVMLVLLLSGWVARSLTRPLSTLRGAALGLAGGDLDRRVSVSGPDEIADLSRAFNDMADRIARAQRDLSTLKDALALRLSEVQEASRLKDEFLGVVSHELRTPLNAILGWSRILRSGSMPNTSRERALETIERNATLQAKLVEDLLDASRIVSGKLQLDMGQVDLERVIHAAVDSVTLAAEAKGVTLTAEATGPAPVRGDAARLQQVVWNLLSNAIKFTPRAGEVTLRLEEGIGETYQLVVTDTGQGITADFLPHVFERFRQADATVTRKHGGLGLGLAIVRQLVEAHGGTVRVESEGEGKGARFTVELPQAGSWLERASLTSIPGSPEGAPEGASLRPSLTGARVLVVDDEVDAGDLVQSVLSSAGAEVRVAQSAEKALEVFSGWKPDLVVSDIGMPDVDGYALMRQVRAMPRKAGGGVPALALTAFAHEEDRLKALAAGYQMHLAKPVDPGELAAVAAGLIRTATTRA
ncbi:ATP-binding protein [Chondromyces apiculatus]|uniref:histidine kinase n=1 Tax=Chondromyces apiculatus DSM 436 TaxID=1192034 RepID=A0A017TC52_9BACT|nr:ATP-binding protein [Chondromyces apiculatus]EYF06482.1 Hypothetical protein CAP_2012 [Chondromyces apiculatus DSM 436]